MNILLGLMLVCGFSVLAQTEKVVNSDISSVTVYKQRALVERNALVQLDKGNNTLVFKGLPFSIDTKTIQAKADVGVTIMSVTYKTDYLNKAKATQETERLKNRKQELEDSIKILRGLSGVYSKEREMILANKTIGGDNGVSIEELARGADFFRSRLTDIVQQSAKTERKLKRQERELSGINKQLNTLKYRKQQPTIEVTVNVLVKDAGKHTIILDYLVSGAGWTPKYDIRIDDINIPLNLSYKADVFQHTGEEWKSVKLTLSTANPVVSNTKPELTPYYISFNDYYREKKGRRAMPTAMMDMEVEEVASNFKIEAPPVLMEESLFSTDFKILLPYTIPSDNRHYDVVIANYDIKSDYTYSAVPKLSDEVYLTAVIDDWVKYRMLSGRANIFFKGAYQGNSYLKTETFDDSLKVYVGRDKDIVVSKDLLKDYSGKSITGATVKQLMSWQITVKNNKQTEVQITIEDQIPVSQNDDIKVDIIEVTGAVVNNNTGKLLWNLKLKSGEKKVLTIKYEVKYPKDRDVVVK